MLNISHDVSHDGGMKLLMLKDFSLSITLQEVLSVEFGMPDLATLGLFLTAAFREHPTFAKTVPRGRIEG
ncbi:MAG: hypothetical protein IGR80_10180 [Synechococcales cyanobacterium K44_A2020_017]|nr:hypothetical protein [Synechococcales cyanobacterium K44_A2020_017]